MLTAWQSDVPMVIDADGLHFVGLYRSQVHGALHRVVLTPNAHELEVLWKRGGWAEHGAASEPEHAVDKAAAICHSLRVSLVLKGAVDHVFVPTADGHVLHSQTQTPGAPRRCGGQGDVLAGVLGTALGWAFGRASLASKHAWSSADADAGTDDELEYPDDPEHATLAAAVLACEVTRTAAWLAWEEHGRGTVTPDIIPRVGEALRAVVPAEQRLWDALSR